MFLKTSRGSIMKHLLPQDFGLIFLLLWKFYSTQVFFFFIQFLDIFHDFFSIFTEKKLHLVFEKILVD